MKTFRTGCALMQNRGTRNLLFGRARAADAAVRRGITPPHGRGSRQLRTSEYAREGRINLDMEGNESMKEHQRRRLYGRLREAVAIALIFAMTVPTPGLAFNSQTKIALVRATEPAIARN